MKAIVQLCLGSPDGLQMQEIPKPETGDDGVLVRVRAASVNAADLHLMDRLPHVMAALLRMPRTRVPGYDLAGTVEAVGRNATRFRPGDEVFGVARGAFAEYAATTEDRLAAKPRNLTFAEAAAFPVAGCTALQGLRDKAQVTAGERVLVYGAGGGVGTFAVQIAKSMDAHVTAVTHTRNLDFLRSLGADEVIDYAKEDFTRRGERYDVLFDVGANRSKSDCRRVLTANGRHVFAGAPPQLWLGMLRLLATKMSPGGGGRSGAFLARARHADLQALKELAEAGKVLPVIGGSYPLSEVAEAIRALGTGQVRGKLVIAIA